MENAKGNFQGLLPQMKSYDKYEEKFLNNLEVKQKESEEIKNLSEELGLENGKILLDLEAIQKNINSLQTNLELHSKNIDLEWKCPIEIDILEENMKFMKGFCEDQTNYIGNLLTALVGNISPEN